MTKGESEQIAFALYKIAKVEEVINNILVWDAIGPNGIDRVYDLHEAMNALARVIVDDTDRSIKLKNQTEEA